MSSRRQRAYDQAKPRDDQTQLQFTNYKFWASISVQELDVLQRICIFGRKIKYYFSFDLSCCDRPGHYMEKEGDSILADFLTDYAA